MAENQVETMLGVETKRSDKSRRKTRLRIRAIWETLLYLFCEGWNNISVVKDRGLTSLFEAVGKGGSDI